MIYSDIMFGSWTHPTLALGHIMSSRFVELSWEKNKIAFHFVFS